MVAEERIISVNEVIADKSNYHMHYGNDVVVSYVGNLSMFQWPCRLNAFTILVCTQGEMDVSINYHAYTVRESSVLINLPENVLQIHRVRNLRAFTIVLSPEYMCAHGLDVQFLPYVPEVKSSETVKVPLSEINHMLYYLKLFRHALYSRFNAGNEELIRLILSSFLQYIMLLHNHHLPQGAYGEGLPQNATSASKRALFERFMQLIDIHHEQAREVRFYADKLCITPKYLSTVVHDVSGKKATDWINEYVIRTARVLLLHAHMNVQEVSDNLNFNSQSAFGKFFKSHVGMTPSEFVLRYSK